MLSPLDQLTQLLGKLPGLGPRSARRVLLFLLKRREAVLLPLLETLQSVASTITACSVCGNWHTSDPCDICCCHNRDSTLVCVVEDVADLWAIERTHTYKGLYHILGGTLSALDGVRPRDLKIDSLLARVREKKIREVILALGATVEGQTTSHYIVERLAEEEVLVSRLAHGLPVGGELDYLDDGTVATAIQSRLKA